MNKTAAVVLVLIAIIGAVAVLPVSTPKQNSNIPNEKPKPASVTETMVGVVSAASSPQSLPLKKPPVSGIIVGDPHSLTPEGIFFVSAATPFDIKAVGGVSGIAKTEYRIDNGGWTAYEQFTVAVEGAHLIEYRSIDNAGNEESPRSVSIVVDQSPPVTAAFIDGKPVVPGKPTLVGKKSIMTLETKDAGIGPVQAEYRIDNGEWQPYAAFSLPSTGIHTVVYRSRDLLGNSEDEQTVTVTSARIPLKTNIAVGKPESSAKAVPTISDKTPLTLTVESMSGVAKTEYKVDNGQWQKYEPFTIAGEGQHRVSFRSIDDSGVKEAEKVLVIAVDATGPVTDVYAGERKLDRNSSQISNTNLEFKLKAVDHMSAVKTTEYRVNGGSWVPYAPFGFAAEGKYEIEYRSADILGNVESAGSYTAIIDKTPPVSELKVGQPKKEQDGLVYVSTSTIFQPKGVDGLSAVEKVEYRIDGLEDTLDTVPFSIVTPGKYRIDYQGYDKAGNKEPLKTMLVVVDLSLPSGGSAGGPSVSDAAGEKKREFSFAAKSVVDSPVPAMDAVAAVPVVDRIAAADEKKNLVPVADGVRQQAIIVPDPLYTGEYQAPVFSGDPQRARVPYMTIENKNNISLLEYLTLGIVNIAVIIGVMLL